MTRFHPEVMLDAQGAVLARLGPVLTKLGFYLVGGTAVALQIGHRRSMDLDWFAPGLPEDPLALAATLRDEGLALDVRATGPGALHGIMDGVLVSFIRHRYGTLNDLLTWPEYSCRVANPEDLISMKLAAIAGRGARKDFFDLAALADTGYSLPDMLRLFRVKYATDDIGHVLAALVYFDDADREPDPVLLSAPDWDDVKGRFRVWVKTYAG